jgi:hypothetical protein
LVLFTVSDDDKPAKQEPPSYEISEWNPRIEPKVVMAEGDREFKLISDSVLLGGTKQRAAVPFISKRASSDLFAYAGAPTGYAQVRS